MRWYSSSISAQNSVPLYSPSIGRKSLSTISVILLTCVCIGYDSLCAVLDVRAIELEQSDVLLLDHGCHLLVLLPDTSQQLPQFFRVLLAQLSLRALDNRVAANDIQKHLKVLATLHQLIEPFVHFLL
jgi:hypothetical protein